MVAEQPSNLLFFVNCKQNFQCDVFMCNLRLKISQLQKKHWDNGAQPLQEVKDDLRRDFKIKVGKNETILQNEILKNTKSVYYY